MAARAASINTPSVPAGSFHKDPYQCSDLGLRRRMVGGGVSVQHGALPEPCRLHLCLSDLPCEGQHLRRARLSVLECQLSHRSPGDRTLAGDRAAGC